MSPNKRARASSSTAESSAAVTPILLTGGTACPPSIVALWRQGRLCDTEVRAGGAAFQVHRIVLAGASDYVAARAGGERFADSLTPLVLPEISADIFDAVLDFAYTGECSVPADGSLLAPLLQAAGRLQIMALQAAVEAAIIDRLHPSNCFSVWEIADRLNRPQLEAASLTSATAGFVEATGGEAWHSVPLARAVALLGDQRLSLRSEADVYDAAVGWLRAQPSPPAEADVLSVLRCVRFALLERWFLSERVVAEPLMQTAGAMRLMMNAILGTRPSVRGGCCARHVLVLGGTSGDGRLLAEAECYDTEADVWWRTEADVWWRTSARAPLHPAPMPNPRDELAAAVVNGVVHVCGGRGAEEVHGPAAICDEPSYLALLPSVISPATICD